MARIRQSPFTFPLALSAQHMYNLMNMKRNKHTCIAGWPADALVCRPVFFIAAMAILVSAIPAHADYRIPAYVDTSAFNEVDFNLQGEYPLPATMTLAKTDEPNPVVILFNGFSLRDRDESVDYVKPFRDIAWGLAGRGIASIRFDSRAYTLGPDTVAAFGLDEYLLDDITALLSYIRFQPNLFDTTKIFIAGYGLGGYVAPLVAKREARPPHEALLSMIGDAFSDTPDKNLMMDKAQSLIRRLADREIPPDQILLFGPARLWYDLMDSSGVDAAEQVTAPFLVIQGGHDEEAGPEDFAIWKKALANRQNVALHRYDDLNHFYQPESAVTQGTFMSRNDPTPVDKRVIDDIAEWILKLR